LKSHPIQGKEKNINKHNLTKQIYHYEVTSKAYQIHSKEYDIIFPKDIEILLNRVTENDFQKDEKLPYWASVWPSAIALAHFIDKDTTIYSHKKILEIGCGLGYTSLILSNKTPFSFSFDYDMEALEFSTANYLLNQNKIQFQPHFFLMDWRNPSIQTKFDYIVGSDILYEKRFFRPLKELLKNYLKKEGKIILSEPGRSISHDFLDEMKKNFLYQNTELPFDDEETNVHQNIQIHQFIHKK